MMDATNEDSVTKLNTQLNMSMVLMDDAMDILSPSSPNHKRKSITINTETQPSRKAYSPVKSRKSILKGSNKSDNMTVDEVVQFNDDDKKPSQATLNRLSSLSSVLSRPRTLEEIVQKEALSEGNIPSTFSLEDVSDSEEFWIMDIPKLIDPQELRGQTIDFEDKSKFKIKDERYCIVAHNMNHNITCVFNSKKDTSGYKTVNIKPAGFLTVRRKLPGTPEIKPVPTDCGVQFPDNLRTRHPLFGVIRERKRRSKKPNSLTACS